MKAQAPRTAPGPLGRMILRQLFESAQRPARPQPVAELLRREQSLAQRN